MKKAKLIGILVLALLLGILVIQNRGAVETRFLVMKVEMPLILLLLLTAGGGFCMGLLVALLGPSKKEGKPPPPGSGERK